IDVHTHNALARNFMGSAHAPFIMQPLKDKDAVTKMLTPQLEVPALDKNTDLLKTLDSKLRRDDAQNELIAGWTSISRPRSTCCARRSCGTRSTSRRSP